MNILTNHPSYEKVPSSSLVGQKCMKNPAFDCECHRNMINADNAENNSFHALKNFGKIRLMSGPVTNDTPGFLPLKYEQPG